MLKRDACIASEYAQGPWQPWVCSWSRAIRKPTPGARIAANHRNIECRPLGSVVIEEMKSLGHQESLRYCKVIGQSMCSFSFNLFFIKPYMQLGGWARTVASRLEQQSVQPVSLDTLPFFPSLDPSCYIFKNLIPEMYPLISLKSTSHLNASTLLVSLRGGNLRVVFPSITTSWQGHLQHAYLLLDW